MKILFLSRWFPHPADSGARTRILNLIKQLALHHDVALFSFTDPDIPPSTNSLELMGDLCARVVTLPYREFQPNRPTALGGLLSPTPRSLLDTYQPGAARAIAAEHAAHRPGLILASELQMIPYALLLSGTPLLLEELELSTFVDATFPRRGRLRQARGILTWFKLAGYLRRNLPRFAACTVVSERERAHVRSAVPGYRPVSVIPNALDLASYAGRFEAPEPETLLFSGALTYHANLDAARFFLGDVYPSIVHRLSNVRVRLTGKAAPALQRGLPKAPGVEFTGYVPDIHPVIAGSWASVVPLRLGGGTRLKILESMALGTPVIATPKGAEGLNVTDGENILIAATAQEFARRTIEVLESPDLRARLAAGGRRLVESTYNWATVGTQFEALVIEAAQVRAA